MPTPSPSACQLRTIIHDFIDRRLVEKQKGKSDEDAQSLAERYDHVTWLKDASRRASQLTVVTHAPKFSHPDSKSDGFRFESSIDTDAQGLAFSMGAPLRDDVFGNAAALDVFKFLQTIYKEDTLLSRVLRDDPEIAAALSDDPSTAAELMGNFKAIASTPGTAACDTFIKQIYFPLADGTYHLLGILHPTSLAHQFHEYIQHDKFSDETKAARDSHKAWKKTSRAEEPSTKSRLAEETLPVRATGFYRVYPDLALRKFGGSKPQNISQLNSERGGRGYLLASLPPSWSARPPALPVKQNTIFDTNLTGRLNLRKTFSRVKSFYKNSYDNASLRDWAEEQIAEAIAKVMGLADYIQQAEPGWSVGSRLHPAEVAWLDPDRELADQGYHAAAEWREIVASHFANWLNFNLSKKTNLMNQEAAGEWRRRFLKEIPSTR